MNKTVWLDMDGTIANLYAVEGWLEKLRSFDPSPYANARPLVNMALLARMLHICQRKGYSIGIVSALSKTSTPEYDAQVISAKRAWLARHLPSVAWDKMNFIAYETVKNSVNAGDDILIDDETRHLNAWTGTSAHASEIFSLLRSL